MKEHFLKYGAGRIALYGIIGAVIMLIYNSHERTEGIHHVYAGNLQLSEVSNVLRNEPTLRKI